MPAQNGRAKQAIQRSGGQIHVRHAVCGDRVQHFVRIETGQDHLRGAERHRAERDRARCMGNRRHDQRNGIVGFAPNRRAQRFQHRCDLIGMVLARSAASDESRKRRRYFAFLDRFTRQAEVDATEGNADDTLREMLNRNMKLLAADDQDLMDRKYSAGESVRDIALSLDMTEKAVESRLARIRQKLREAVLADLEE